MKKICFILCFLGAFFLSKGQTIAINSSEFDVGPYGQGSTITLPITTTGCFNAGNVFNLYLSDNNGNFIANGGNGTLIGSFSGFFATFVNGVIPSNTSAGSSYRLKVVSTSPAAIVSNTTNSFVINASAGPIAKANPNDPDRILVNQIYFGWCSGIKSNNIVLDNQSTSGSVVSAIIKNGKTLSDSSLSLTANQFNISVVPNYYTLTVKAVNNGNLATISYFIINSPNNMNLSSSGSQTGCLPNDSYFQILTTSASVGNGIGDNFPGTQYRVDWGDGTSTIYKHCELIAVNGSISHSYNQTSCTVTDGVFYVTAKLQNPFYSLTGTQIQQNCDQPPFSTSVRILQKPTSNFTFSQYSCVNKPVTFINTSIAGQAQSGSNCVSSAKYSWFVDNVLANSTNYNITQTSPLSLNYIFTTIGKHVVKLVVDNGSCDMAAKEDTICIEPLPVPNFTISPPSCAPSGFTPVNTTNSNPCKPMTFAWSILDSLGNNTVSNTYYNISNTSDFEPSINITKPGKYQLQLAVTNSCSTVVNRQAITVGGTPTAILPAKQSYCGVKTIDFGSDVNHKPTYDSQFGTSPTYNWSVTSSTGGTFSFINATNATSAYPKIQFDSIGIYTVSVTYSTNCGTATTASQQITFKAIPTFTVTPTSQVVCGGYTTLPISFNSVPTGALFNWTNNNASIGLAASGNGNVNSFTTTKPATQQLATISIIPNLNGCLGAANAATITVNATTLTPTTLTSVALCQNVATVPLTATALAGDTLKWYDAGNTLLSTAPTPSVTNIGTTVYYVSQINTTTHCESDKLAISVNVNAATTIDTLSTNNPTICNSATGIITLKGLLPNTGYTLNYTKNSVAVGPVTITSDGSGYFAITGLSLGTYNNIKVGANNCASNALGPINLTDPNPPAKPVATSDITICSDSTIILSATSATSGVSFNWVGPNNYSIANNATPTITGATVAMSGLYIVSTTLNGCTSTSDTVNVVVNQTPVAPIVVTPVDYCQFFVTPAPLSATTTNGNTLYWYTQPTGGSSSTTAPTVSTATVGTTIYYVNQINNTSSCQSSRAAILVTISENTSIDTLLTTNTSVCLGTDASITLKGLIVNKNYSLNYTKNGVAVAPISITSTNSGTYVISGLTAGTYSNIIVGLNGCQSNSLGPIVLSDPNPPAKPVASSNGTVCSDSTITLSATSTTLGVAYNWTGPNGFTSSLATPTITGATVAASGSYIVFSTLNACNSINDTVIVVVNQTPVKPTVASNSPVCEGNSINLTASSTTSGTINYKWAGPNAFTSATQNPIITNALPANAGYYSVFAINTSGNCISKSDSVSVTVNGALSNTISNTAQSICAKQFVTIIGQAPVGGGGFYSYQWQQSTDGIAWVDISGATASNITFSPSATVYVRRVVFSSTCTAPSNAALITVQPSIGNNNVSKDSAICIGSAAPNLIGTLPSGGNGTYTYQWENSNDGGNTWVLIASATAKDYLPPVPNTSIKYRRIVTSSLCTGTEADTSNVVTITVNAHATALYTYTKDIACATFNIAANVQNITNSANGSYEWYANNILIGTGTNMPAYSITNAFDSVVIKLKAISQFGCNNDSLSHKFYTSPVPIPSFTVSDSVGCGLLTVSVTNTTSYANLFNFKWDFGNGTTSTIANPSAVTYQTNPTHLDSLYTISLAGYSACQTVSATKIIRVKAKPQALFTPNKSVGCSPFNATFNNTSRGSNVSYIWDFGDGTAPLATSNTNSVQHTYNTGIQDTFNVKLIAINECGSDTITYNIIVSPNTIKLDFAVNATDVSSCLPSTVRFINNTSGATSFNWDFGDGNVLTTTKNIDTVTHVYTTAGTFITKLSATNGCSDTTDYEQIKAYAKPITKFIEAPLTACLGDSVFFTNKTDTATGYTWNFGDGNTSALTSPLHIYTSVGTYNAKLIAVRQYTGIACTDSAVTNITVVAKLNGSFKVSDSVSNCVPFKVLFTNLSLPSVLTTWDYGDGVKDTGNLVQHTYTTSGTFTAKMTAVNAGGCTYESTKTIVVKGPTGTWLYDKGLICAKKSVQFQVNALNADSLRFNFGDGTFLTTTNAIINHAYAQSGNYLPSVQLITIAGCYVTLQGVDTIKIDKITAGFATVQQKTCGSTSVGFTDTTRSFYGVQTWQWNFGDGSALVTTQNTQHTYTVGNTYTVQLITVGKSGCSDTALLPLPITINSKPNATIQANAISCANQKVNYSSTITSIDSIILKLWRFATGATVLGNTAAYAYTNAGTYTTAFVTGTINGCYDTTYNTITVNPSPSVTASTDVTICKGASTQLLATGSSNIVWAPATNLSCTACSNPLAFPSINTAYVASSTNGFGCTSTDTVVITVVQPFTISVTSSDSICIGQSTKLGASGAFSYVWSPTTGLSNSTIQNPVANPVVTTTYQVTGKDQYNCFTSTASVVIGVGYYPVVNLGQDQVLAAGSTYTFTPTFTNGPIASWLWTPSANLNCATCPSVTATAINDVCYVANATNIYGCAASDTVCIKVFCQSSQVFIPNAFMPGTGTGVNDVLMVRGTGIKLVKSFRIYNRWGQVVFERANFIPNDRQYGWDGLIQGKPANTDVYIYTCEVVCENDTPFTYKGNVAIIR